MFLTDQPEKVAERVYHASCVDLIIANYHEMEGCFIEIGSREIVEDFVSVCKSAFTSELWTRMAMVCDALDNAFLQINAATGRTSRSFATHQSWSGVNAA